MLVWAGSSWLRIGTGGQALVNAVMNLRVSLNVGNFFTSRKPVRFSRRTLLHGAKGVNPSKPAAVHPHLSPQGHWDP